MEYVDNKVTNMYDQGLAVHQYRMNNDPRYRNYNKLVSEDTPLEDTSADMLLFAGPVSNGLAKTSAGIRESMQPVKVPVDLGRREALKTIGGTAAVAATASPVVGMLLGKTSATVGGKTGVNLAELAKYADEMRDIGRSAGSFDKLPMNKEAANIIQKARDSAAYLQSKFPMEGETVKGSGYHRAAGNQATLMQSKEDYINAMKKAGRPINPSKLKEYGYRIAENRLDMSKWSPEDIQHFNNIVENKRMINNVGEKISALKDVRDSALSTKSPVLDIASIKSERARTLDRIEDLSKAPDKQSVVKYRYDENDAPIDSFIEHGVVNEAKQNKMNYLRKRLENLDEQLSSLAKTGKHESVKILRPKDINMKNSNRDDIWTDVIDYGPY